ncbi:hypothetical protein MK489_05770 [Myxococcota bacterium]|nr:hypothetical protein [Myxococcota bacterium]
MDAANGLALYFVRCNAPARFEEWGRWLRERHLPEMSKLDVVRAASHWALTQQPKPGMPSVGFSHVTIYELVGDIESGARALEQREAESRQCGEIDANHCVMDVDILEAHGSWNQKPVPTDALTGHIMAYVMCNDPRREAEWDAWNDAVHMPDMLESNGFTGVSRWRRRGPNTRGARYLTLYDVGPIGVEAAVERSAAVMPGIAAAGRKLDCHVGGLTVTLERA